MRGESRDYPSPEGVLGSLIFSLQMIVFYSIKPNLFEWSHIQAILEAYEKATGQKVNINKTSIFFSHNTHPDTKNYILSVAGVDSTQRYEKYLGLSTVIGHSKVNAFAGVKGKV